ncbi:MAG: DUF1553 domain-containing protein [Bryobacteraceae bacterium]|nr:DUF1553 domain-containing protein [Bryobacteraceae bacterium]
MFRLRTGLAVLLFLATGALLLADAAADEKFIGARRNWWAFRKAARPAVPPAAGRWVRNPIDSFLLAAMREKGLAPSPELDRRRLARRLYLDVTGLPPSPADVDAYLADRAPGAYERLVDRLLASPRYGERWALKWLDVVRYADTNGFELDAERPHAWRYRDYVVRSFNDDKPFNRFLMEQIAGDEWKPGDPEMLIAAGFHRVGPVHLVGGNQDDEMNRQEVLTEMTATVSAVLGMTVGCARCHNHKFDPILQADYYRLQAIFAATEGAEVEIATPEEKAAHERAMKEYEARIKPVKDQLAAIEKPVKQALKDKKKALLEPRLREALEIPKEKRTPEQAALAKAAEEQTSVSWDELVAALPDEVRARRAGLRKQMHAIDLMKPDPLPTAYTVKNLEKAPVTHILKVGDHRQKLDPVAPGFPTVLGHYGAKMTPGAAGRRTALAQWLTSPEHPLTARVMGNRVWQLRMGAGLVGTPNDYGLLGSKPTNPALLDWLAAEFVEGGWSAKSLDRLILTSSAYRQSAVLDPAKAKIDPDNRLYWRANRKRLEAEHLRDSVLAAAGTLNLKMGGKPVRVPIEKEIYDIIFTEDEPDNLWPLSPDTSEYNRRSLYLLNKRTVRLPMLANFDQPDAMTSCPTRPVSTHALQALTLFNSEFMARQSEAFAARVSAACAGKGRDCRIRSAYRMALAREPLPAELQMARGFLSRSGALADFALALLNRNEFVYVP